MRPLVAIGVMAAAAVVLPAARPAAQGPPAPAPRISVVRADVIVSDARRRPVENLTPADFAIVENGAPQTLDAVRFVKIGRDPQSDFVAVPIRSAIDEQEQAARDGTRLVAILLDEYHVSAASTGRVRDALARFVDQDLGPRDLVAVLKPLDSLLTIRMTRDREQIRHAIDTFQGRLGEYEARTPFEQNFIAGAPARIEQVRAQVATSALNALVVHLGRLADGRKSIVMVSDGLTRSVRRRGESLPTIDAVIRSANRYNVSIYPMTPDAADGSGEPAPEAETLRALADGTDGHALVAGGNADGEFQQIMDDASAYYLLTYRSTHVDDGNFREVQVHVKRPGVSVRARKGYWALWPDEAFVGELLRRGNEPAPSTLPPAFDVPRRTSPLIRPWFGTSRGADGKVRVTFVWEPAGRVPGDRSRVGPPARVALKALGPDGTLVFDGIVMPAAVSELQARADPAVARAVFDVSPGRLRLVMAIEDAGTQSIDSDAREIAIRDLKGPVALGTAEVLRIRTARDFRAVDADPDAVPVASREFSRTERLIIRFPAYAPGGPPHASARLLGRSGAVLRDLPVGLPRTDGGLFQIDLPLAGFAPGEYSIEISASSPAGEAKDLLGFRVTN
jgi:VWFA-related protein